MTNILKMGPSPHIRTSETVEKVMYDVIISLIPAFLVAVYVFGIRAFIVTSVAVLSCIVTEFVCQKIMKQDISVFDGSAILTGIFIFFRYTSKYVSYLCNYRIDSFYRSW